MFRAQYVNFGTEERIVCYHTVNVGSNRAGLRWYELSRPSGGSTWTIRQSGTYAPNDGLHRWCGGISINQNKQIALMYSVTGVSNGTNYYPGIRICGQSAAANAAANGTLDIPETIIVNGGTYQASYNRWGDYTQLSVDPVDKVTFWGTTQYMKTSTSTKYTKIVAFRFDETLNNPPVADFIGNPTTVIAGGTVSFTDQSTNNPTSWQWSFPGGTPSTSTQQNPTVTYNTPGTYNVTLIVSNQYGSDTITKTAYINVLNQSAGFSLDFEACSDWSTDFTPWLTLDQDGKATYGSSDCNFTGEGSAFGFMAFNPSLAGCFASHGGQRCGVAICPSDASQADNWLISAPLQMQTGGSISFWVQSPKPGTWGNETYDVLVSTTNNQPASFTAIATNETAPSTWLRKHIA
jgi:PKD repeat protein